MHFTPLPYLDPGSGSFIIQIAIAALLGLGCCHPRFVEQDQKIFWNEVQIRG